MAMNTEEASIIQNLYVASDEKSRNEYFITIKDFSSVCRTCLSQSDLKPILHISYDGLSISELLQAYTAIQVQEEDQLPKNICSLCLDEVVRSHLFKQKCGQADDLLQSIKTNNVSSVTANDFDNSTEENDGYNEESIKFEITSDNVSVVFNDDEEPQEIICTRSSKHKRRRSDSAGPPYECKICSKSYRTKNELKEHRRVSKHAESRNHTCSICSKMFTSSKLKQHMRAHTKEKPYKCKVCTQAFSMSGNLKRHMMTHTGERPHVCEVCGKGFIQATTLQKHRNTHANNEQTLPDSPGFLCNYCGRGFKRISRYNAHLKKHFVDNGESKVKQPETEVREYVCEICKRAYKTKNLLKAHQLTHGEKTFLCSDCGKGFVTKAALISHFKVHTGEKPHTCSVCNKSFAHIGSFEAHMLIHTGQKPYNCNICTKAFTQLSHLKYHLRTHSGERPYICSYCGKGFALKGNLTVHIRIHTGETPYMCPVCNKGFYDSSSMKKHRKGHGEINVSTDFDEVGVSLNSENSDQVYMTAEDECKKFVAYADAIALKARDTRSMEETLEDW